MSTLYNHQHSSKKISLKKVFLWGLFFIAPFVDAINGYLVLSGITSEGFIGSPSQLLRGVLFIWAVNYVPRKYSPILYFFVVYFLVIEISSFFYYIHLRGAIIALVTIYKLIYPIAIFLALKGLLNSGFITFEKLKIYFFKSAFLYALGIVLPFLLGIGYPTYIGGGFGTKGFFASGNGTGMFLGIISLFCYHEKIYKLSKLYFFMYLIIVLGVFFIATKATAIFLLLLTLLFFLQLPNMIKGLVAILILAFLYNSYDILMDNINVMFDVIMYRYENSPNFMTFILSGRNNMVSDAFEQFDTGGLYFLRPIFGSGTFLSFQNPSGNSQIFDMLETDIVDVFFMFGVIGVLIYLHIFLKPVYFFFLNRLWVPLLLFIAVFFHSLLAGHVIFNGMSIMGVVLMYLYYNSKRYDLKSFSISSKFSTIQNEK